MVIDSKMGMMDPKALLRTIATVHVTLALGVLFLTTAGVISFFLPSLEGPQAPSAPVHPLGLVLGWICLLMSIVTPPLAAFFFRTSVKTHLSNPLLDSFRSAPESLKHPNLGEAPRKLLLEVYLYASIVRMAILESTAVLSGIALLLHSTSGASLQEHPIMLLPLCGILCFFVCWGIYWPSEDKIRGSIADLLF